MSNDSMAKDAVAKNSPKKDAVGKRRHEEECNGHG